MVQSYSRHGPTEVFGIICSSSSNSVYDGKLAYVPALEDILVWDVKKGQLNAMWHVTGLTAEVTCLLRSPKENHYAAGYADGSVRLWNSFDGNLIVTFNGHKRPVTALAFDGQETRLASGSQDTDIIIWDLVAEEGLFRLCGHRDQITAIRFLADSTFPSASTAMSSGFLLTTSKDTFLKLWNMSAQHCVQTIVAHPSEIWTMDVNKEKDMVLTGSGEGEIKAWRIDHKALTDSFCGYNSEKIAKIIIPLATFPLASRHRVSQLNFHMSKPYLAVQSHDRSVEIFRIRTEEDIRKKQLRRKKRVKDKSDHSHSHEESYSNENLTEIQLSDVFTPHVVIRASGKISSFCFCGGSDFKNLQILTALASNALEVYSMALANKSGQPPEVARVFSVDFPGHRSDVRTLSLSSNDQMLASASNGSLKLWNMKSNACIRTMECGYAICSTFLPGDKHVAIGTKSGNILIYDLSSSTLIETINAHSGTVWSLHVRPDLLALVSGGADKDVKFWEIKLKISKAVTAQSEKLQCLVHIRTLKMTDDVLVVRYSSDGKLLAVALLDSTVKVFFQDTLKFYLSLYGHKLPVLSMDISDDSKLIATCSSDKNVKIWGLDFGDCHKSLFAHGGSVMQVAFEKGSHYFWTVGKDKLLKYWDGDKFENIQILEGHHSEVWALSLSNSGNFVVTASHDKSIRIWEKLEEPLFLEEERERELEVMYETGIADSLFADSTKAGVDGGSQSTPSLLEATSVTKQTAETLMAGERIIEAIDLADNERTLFMAYLDDVSKLTESEAITIQPPAKNPILTAHNLEHDEYVLQVIEKIPSSSLHDALLVLPFGKVVSLIYYLNTWARKSMNLMLISRIIFFLLRTHHYQIVSNKVLRALLIPLQKHLRLALEQQKSTVGYNLAALRYMRRQNDAERSAQFEEDKDLDENEIRARLRDAMKRKRVQLNAR